MKKKLWTVRVEMNAGNFYIYHDINSFSKTDAENQAIRLNHVESRGAKVSGAFAWSTISPK